MAGSAASLSAVVQSSPNSGAPGGTWQFAPAVELLPNTTHYFLMAGALSGTSVKGSSSQPYPGRVLYLGDASPYTSFPGYDVLFTL